jgi:hypothetical protein
MLRNDESSRAACLPRRRPVTDSHPGPAQPAIKHMSAVHPSPGPAVSQLFHSEVHALDVFDFTGKKPLFFAVASAYNVLICFVLGSVLSFGVVLTGLAPPAG